MGSSCCTFACELDSLHSNLTMYQKGQTWLKSVHCMLKFSKAKAGRSTGSQTNYSVSAVHRGEREGCSIKWQKRNYFWQLCKEKLIECNNAECICSLSGQYKSVCISRIVWVPSALEGYTLIHVFLLSLCPIHITIVSSLEPRLSVPDLSGTEGLGSCLTISGLHRPLIVVGNVYSRYIDQNLHTARSQHVGTFIYWGDSIIISIWRKSSRDGRKWFRSVYPAWDSAANFGPEWGVNRVRG